MARRIVALDLGSTGIRAAQINLSGRKPVIEKIAAAPLPRGTITGGVVRDPHVLTAALQTLWATHKFKTEHVALALANQDVIVRRMEVPWAPPRLLAEDLHSQIAEVVDLDATKVVSDFHVLGEYQDTPEGTETAQRMVRVLVVATTVQIIDGFVGALREANLLPVRIDLLPFVLINALHASAPSPDQGTEQGTEQVEEAAEEMAVEAIIDIGADVTSVVMHHRGRPLFVRILAGQGGNVITDALADTFGWSLADAERTKIALGVPTAMMVTPNPQSVFAGSDTAPAAPQEHPATEVIVEVVSGFVRDLRESVTYSLAAGSDNLVLSRVVLTGAASLLTGLAPRLASELRAPVTHATALTAGPVALGKNATLPESIVEQQTTALVGLALGATTR